MAFLPLARHPPAGLRWPALALAAAILLAPPRARAADILVFAAASTTNAIADIARMAGMEGHGKVVTSFASSSVLAKQISRGAPADIFISANVKWMNYLENKDAVIRKTRRDLMGNALVLIAPRDRALPNLPMSGVIDEDYPLAKVVGRGRLAMGDPDHVPAGVYGKQALVNLSQWSFVTTRLAAAANVRAALALVERGEAAAGIVYATDAAIVADKVVVIGTFPESSHRPIIYPAAILAGHDREEVRRLFAFLASAKAAAVFARYGFRPLAGKP